MKIAIITPLKDEIENLPRLYESIGAIDGKIDHWIICENGSTDGSVEFLRAADKPPTVDNLHVLNVDTGTPEYQLGFKYSRIVEAGLKFLMARDGYRDICYIGILDADCFPRPDYYRRLLDEFALRDRLGILSGTLVRPDGTRLPAARGFPRGNSRVWRRRCIEEAPYIVGMSADALTAIRAEARGWDCDALPDALVETRDIGRRAGQRYYGEAAYYRGETVAFTLIKSIRRSLSSPRSGMNYFRGYVGALVRRSPRVDDAEIIEYSRGKLARRMRRRS